MAKCTSLSFACTAFGMVKWWVPNDDYSPEVWSNVYIVSKVPGKQGDLDPGERFGFTFDVEPPPQRVLQAISESILWGLNCRNRF